MSVRILLISISLFFQLGGLAQVEERILFPNEFSGLISPSREGVGFRYTRHADSLQFGFGFYTGSHDNSLMDDIELIAIYDSLVVYRRWRHWKSNYDFSLSFGKNWYGVWAARNYWAGSVIMGIGHSIDQYQPEFHSYPDSSGQGGFLTPTWITNNNYTGPWGGEIGERKINHIRIGAGFRYGADWVIARYFLIGAEVGLNFVVDHQTGASVILDPDNVLSTSFDPVTSFDFEPRISVKVGAVIGK